jgi:hypothetical protein
MSAKSLLTVFRNYDTTGVAEGYALSTFTNPFYGAGSHFVLDVGGVMIPNNRINVRIDGDISEFWSENQKAQHALWDLEANGCLSRTCYTSEADIEVTDTPNSHGFILGVNLDQQVHQSEVLLAGLDTSKATSYLQANFATAITGNPCTVNSWVYHDCLLIIDQFGGLTAKA